MERGQHGRRMILHVMHSVSDWFAHAIWDDGVLVRSLSLAPDSGMLEDIGVPQPFEAPFWAGEHPVTPSQGWPGPPVYPLPLHPLELGEAALRELTGFVLEGRQEEPGAGAGGAELIEFAVTPADPVTKAQVDESSGPVSEPASASARAAHAGSARTAR